MLRCGWKRDTVEGFLVSANAGRERIFLLFALCDRNDIGGVSTAYHAQVGGPAIFVHDAHPGGVGIAETAFRLINEWLGATRTLLTDCPCETGCPSCIQFPQMRRHSGNLPRDIPQATQNAVGYSAIWNLARNQGKIGESFIRRFC